MLREPWEAAAIDVLVQAIEQADLFKYAAEHLTAHDHPRTAALCAEMAEHRQQFAAELEAGLRARGVYPKRVDPEREAVDHFFVNLKSALSHDEADSLLQSRWQADKALRDALAEARATEDMPDALADILRRFDEGLEEDDRRIDQYLTNRRRAD